MTSEIELYKKLLVKKDKEVMQAQKGWAEVSSENLKLEEEFKDLLISARILEEHLYKMINEFFKMECFDFSTKSTFETSIAQVFEDFFKKHQGLPIDLDSYLEIMEGKNE